MKLFADNIHQIHLISALIQNSINHPRWVKYNQNKVTILLNRMKREIYEPYTHFRVNSVVEIHNVEKCYFKKGINDFRYLCAVICTSNREISMVFSDKSRVHMLVSNLYIQLSDMGNSWPSNFIPRCVYKESVRRIKETNELFL